MSKVSRGQKGEEIVALTLNNIKCKHYVLNNVTFINNKSDMSHQIDHILIHPHGVFVIETKNYYGHIIVEPKANRWIRSIKGLMKQIPNPLLQNKSHAISRFRKSYYFFIKIYLIFYPERKNSDRHRMSDINVVYDR